MKIRFKSFYVKNRKRKIILQNYKISCQYKTTLMNQLSIFCTIQFKNKKSKLTVKDK